MADGRAPRVVVLGAGYAGLAATLYLRDYLAGLADRARPFHLCLVDRQPQHELITRLHEVAAGSLSAAAAAMPLESLLADPAVDISCETVSQLDVRRRCLLTERGARLPYDFLLLAPGSQTAFRGVPGLREHAFALRTLADAQALHHHLREVLRAAQRETAARRRQALLTFVVGGGGFTGTELAAELADRLPHTAAALGLDPNAVTVVLIEAQDRLIGDFDRSLAEEARRRLEALGVAVLLRTRVIAAGAGRVRLRLPEREGSIATYTMIWTGGVCAPDFLRVAGLPTGVDGRVRVDRYLRVPGAAGVYTLGDCALWCDPSGRPLPPSAQFAIQQGQVAAGNVLAALTGGWLHPYRPRRAGEALSLGRRDGLGWVSAGLGRVRLRGFGARVLKQITQQRYLYRIGGAAALASPAGAAPIAPVAALAARPTSSGEPRPLATTARWASSDGRRRFLPPAAG